MIVYLPAFNHKFHLKLEQSTPIKPKIAEKKPLFYLNTGKQLIAAYKEAGKIYFDSIGFKNYDNYLQLADSRGNIYYEANSYRGTFYIKKKGQFNYCGAIRNIYETNAPLCHDPVKDLIYAGATPHIYRVKIDGNAVQSTLISTCALPYGHFMDIKYSPLGWVYGTYNVTPEYPSKSELTKGAPYVCNVVKRGKPVITGENTIIDDADRLFWLGTTLRFYVPSKDSGYYTVSQMYHKWKFVNDTKIANDASLALPFASYLQNSRLILLTFSGDFRPNASNTIYLARQAGSDEPSPKFEVHPLTALSDLLTKLFSNQWGPECYNVSQHMLLLRAIRKGRTYNVIAQRLNGIWRIVYCEFNKYDAGQAISADIKPEL